MTYLSIVLTYAFGLFAMICGLLLGGVTFTRKQREHHPCLRKLDGKQLYFLVLTLIFGIGFYSANAWKDFLSVPQTMVPLLSPNGEIITKATLSGFERELEEVAKERSDEATAYFKSGESDLAAQRYRDAAENFQKSLNIFPTMAGYNNLGISFWFDSEFQQAKQAFLSGIQIARKRKHRGFEADFLINLAMVYRTQGSLDKALYYYQQALTLCEEIKYSYGLSSVHSGLGLIHFNQGEWDKALNHHKAALKIDKQLNNLLRQASDFNHIGLVYRVQGERQGSEALIQEALGYHQRALETHTEARNILGRAISLSNIGLVHRVQGEFHKALDYFLQATKLNEEQGNRHGQAYDYGNLGNVYQDLKDMDKSLKAYQKARQIFKELDHLPGLAMVSNNIGAIYQKNNEFEKALACHRMAFELHQKAGNRVGQVNALLNLGVTYYYLEMQDEALKSCQKALYISEQIADRHGETLALRCIEGTHTN